MRYTLEVNIDDDVLRVSGMTPELYLRRSMGSLQEYGIRVIESSEPDLTQREPEEKAAVSNADRKRNPHSPRPRWLDR